MGILSSIENKLQQLPLDIVYNKVFYIELDKVSYGKIDDEVGTVIIQQQKVNDIGKCKVLNWNDCKIIVTEGPVKTEQNDFYLAFKTGII